jgi:hypothetical protein
MEKYVEFSPFVDYCNWTVGVEYWPSPSQKDPLGQNHVLVFSLGPLVLAVRWPKVDRR